MSTPTTAPPTGRGSARRQTGSRGRSRATTWRSTGTSPGSRGKRISVTEAGGAFLIDVDGTLVDTNYHHAIAWYRAFRRHELTLPLWRIHRSMGMGGDQLVKALAGQGVEDDFGD